MWSQQIILFYCNTYHARKPIKHFYASSSRYSTFDALDLEYALLRAAARGSVGPYSLSESLHKLTFTQSLAFPALARSLAAKQSMSTRSQQPTESGLNTIAKVVTAMVLMLVSILVFGVVYKFTKTWGWLLAPGRDATMQNNNYLGASDALNDNVWWGLRSEV